MAKKKAQTKRGPGRPKGSKNNAKPRNQRRNNRNNSPANRNSKVEPPAHAAAIVAESDDSMLDSMLDFVAYTDVMDVVQATLFVTACAAAFVSILFLPESMFLAYLFWGTFVGGLGCSAIEYLARSIQNYRYKGPKLPEYRVEAATAA